MQRRWKKVGSLTVILVLLVAFFQLFWPLVYPSLVDLNRYPTAEYLRIMWLLSPDGLSIITGIIGAVIMVWVSYIER